ncbi:MAG TPA: hypothetical protein VNX25_10085, partial [Verrucomicrobiae bacterium]|nr:hypothetical protein [Verrucomicrobiae bacterium]
MAIQVKETAAPEAEGVAERTRRRYHEVLHACVGEAGVSPPREAVRIGMEAAASGLSPDLLRQVHEETVAAVRWEGREADRFLLAVLAGYAQHHHQEAQEVQRERRRLHDLDQTLQRRKEELEALDLRLREMERLVSL